MALLLPERFNVPAPASVMPPPASFTLLTISSEPPLVTYHWDEVVVRAFTARPKVSTLAEALVMPPGPMASAAPPGPLLVMSKAAAVPSKVNDQLVYGPCTTGTRPVEPPKSRASPMRSGAILPTQLY